MVAADEFGFASGKSNGVRFVSANDAIMKITNEIGAYITSSRASPAKQ